MDNKTNADRNLSAYYYSFEPTGCDLVDAVLETVANAGAGYHNTEDWREERDDGSTPLSDMQAAADKSAAAVLELVAENVAATREATALAMSIWRRCYSAESPNFEPFEKASSIIGQIDNMAAGLIGDLERLRTAEGDAMTYKAGMENVAQQRDQIKQENRLLTEHNEFLASSDSRLAPELRAVKDALGLDFTASVSGEVVPLIERLRKLPTCWTEVLEQSEANDQLLDQVLELSKDADRYRFIVDCPIRTMVALSRKATEAGFDLSAECDQIMSKIAAKAQ